jgi:hypothetical protein
MARNAAKLKMGHFPLPEAEARRIRSLLSFSGPCCVVDPCAGKGTALNLITAGAPVVRLGVELDTGRAEEAAKSGIRMIQGNAFDAQAKVESFSRPFQFDHALISAQGQRRRISMVRLASGVHRSFRPLPQQ